MSEWRERHMWAQTLGQTIERQADGLRRALVTEVITLIPIAVVAFIQTTLSGEYSAPVFRCGVGGQAPAGIAGPQLQAAFQVK